MIRTWLAGSVITLAVAGGAAACPAQSANTGSDGGTDTVTGLCGNEATGMSCGCDDAGKVVYVHPDIKANRVEAIHDCRWLANSYNTIQSAANGDG